MPVNDTSLATLLQASEYYQKLDLLELLLDLMKMDIEDGLAMKKICFDGVKQKANEVVAHAHPASIFEVVDNVTMEGQRIACVANLLGFCGVDMEDLKLVEDDVEWFLTSDGEPEDLEDLHHEDKEAGVSNRINALHLGGVEAKESVTKVVLLRKLLNYISVNVRTSWSSTN